jgi:hypothetical protein
MVTWLLVFGESIIVQENVREEAVYLLAGGKQI